MLFEHAPLVNLFCSYLNKPSQFSRNIPQIFKHNILCSAHYQWQPRKYSCNPKNAISAQFG